MNHRERFAAIMNYQTYDRVPVYFFGLWPETYDRWMNEGLRPGERDARPMWARIGGMDPDWEEGFWSRVNCNPIADEPDMVVEDTDDYCIVRPGIGGLIKVNKRASSIPHDIEFAVQPTRESWNRFKKFLDPDDPRRWPADWEQRVAEISGRDNVVCCKGGSLYGYLRGWLGVEAISYLPYDDAALFAEIIEYLADFYVEVNSRFIKKGAEFDFAYFFEDCCGKSGPLISPAIYKKFFDAPYKRMIRAYRDLGVPLMLVDSDGLVDPLAPCWLDSGFDIIFPVEVGTWRASPIEFRRRYGKRMRMFGGVDKHVIPHGETAIRRELEPLRPLVEEGGFVPIPDHRIPPDCSLAQFREYIRIFNEVFNSK